MAVSIGGLTPAVTAYIQDNTLQRMFKDALFPELLFRRDAYPELWEANQGEVKIYTRKGLLPVNTTPLQPMQDPTPKQFATEQWRVEANQYGDAIDTHMPTSRVAIASKLFEDTKTLGLNAGQTMNVLARNPLFQAYLSGQTNAIANAAIGLSQVRVASINGFTDVLVNGTLLGVSAANPLGVTFTGGEPANSVVAAVADDPINAPLGPGTITLSAALTAGITDRDAVLADNRPRVFRVGGGASVDQIGAADILKLEDITSAVSLLRQNKIPNHPEGVYRHHLGPLSEAQIFIDDGWQRLFESLPESVQYRQFIIGRKVGCDHYRNTECPDSLNSGTLVATSGSAFCAPDIGAEVINNAGVRIGRTIITGYKSLYECYIPEMEYITEAGVQGKVGNFNITNQGVAIDVERVRYTLRAPQDRLQQIVGHAWSWSGDFGIPSDELTTTVRFARCIVIEHAIA